MIKDARDRQQRHRLIAAALVVVGVVVGGLIIGFAGGGGGSPAGQRSAVSQIARNDGGTRCSGTGGSTILTDASGPYTFALYVTNADSGTKYATVCLNGVEDGSGGLTGPGHPWPPPVTAEHTHGFLTEVGSLTPKTATGQSAFTEVGRAGAYVTSVSALLSNGKKVRGAVADGWYLVWWPARRGFPGKLLVTTETKTYEIPDPSLPLPPTVSSRRRTHPLQPRKAPHRGPVS